LAAAVLPVMMTVNPAKVAPPLLVAVLLVNSTIGPLIVKAELPALLMEPPLPDVAMLPEKVAMPDKANPAFAMEIAPPLGAVLFSKETADPLAPIATMPLLVTPMALPLCVVLMFENVTDLL
jgi:hypothetical protein